MKTGLQPLIPEKCRILILGSMPGEKSIEYQEYYANRGNHFRRLIFAVFHVPFDPDYGVLKSLLGQNQIGLWNVIQTCERIGSSDIQIKNPIPNDIDSLFRKHPTIQQVFFESVSARKFHDKLIKRNPDIHYGNLPSTSGLNSRLSFEDKLGRWKIIREI